VVGVQFHPESILTERGYALLAGFLRQAGLAVADELVEFPAEQPELQPATRPLPQVPVTF
jgi:hypothetical protein